MYYIVLESILKAFAVEAIESWNVLLQWVGAPHSTYSFQYNIHHVLLKSIVRYPQSHNSVEIMRGKVQPSTQHKERRKKKALSHQPVTILFVCMQYIKLNENSLWNPFFPSIVTCSIFRMVWQFQRISNTSVSHQRMSLKNS